MYGMLWSLSQIDTATVNNRTVIDNYHTMLKQQGQTENNENYRRYGKKFYKIIEK